MIYPLAGIVFGALFGGFRARMKGGRRLDVAQWAAVYAMMFGLIGLFVLIFIERSFVH